MSGATTLTEALAEVAGDEVRLRWLYPTNVLPAGAAFDVPVEVVIGGRRARVEMPGGEGSLRVPAGAEVVVMQGLGAQLSPERSGWFAEKLALPDTTAQCLPA